VNQPSLAKTMDGPARALSSLQLLLAWISLGWLLQDLRCATKPINGKMSSDIFYFFVEAFFSLLKNLFFISNPGVVVFLERNDFIIKLSRQ
jgi:hypothetical protein